jgi:hypothetical protein
MNIDDAFPSKYLKAEDLNGKPYTLTMREVCMLEIDEGREKAVLFFIESQKGLVLNQTNTNVIKYEVHGAVGGQEDRGVSGPDRLPGQDRALHQGKGRRSGRCDPGDTRASASRADH